MENFAQFDLVGIIFVLIIVAFFIIGVVRGFVKTLVSLIKGFASFIVSFFIANPFGNLIYNMGLGGVLKDAYTNGLFSNQAFQTVITEENKTTVVADCLKAVSLPESTSTLLSMFSSWMINDTNFLNKSVADVFSTYMATYSCIIIAFIFWVIILTVVVQLLGKLLDKLIKTKDISKSINGILGAALNVVFALIIISVLCFILSALVTMDNDFANYLVTSMQLNTNKFTISKFFMENNPLLAFMNWLVVVLN